MVSQSQLRGKLRSAIDADLVHATGQVEEFVFPQVVNGLGAALAHWACVKMGVVLELVFAERRFERKLLRAKNALVA